MSTLTLTLLRLGLLALLWIFIFSVVGVLRTDIFGTRVSRRSQRRARKAETHQVREAAPAPVPAPAPAPERSASRGSMGGFFGRNRNDRTPSLLAVVEGTLTGTTVPLRAGGVLIGRNPECALILDDDYASGRHCRVYQEPSAGGAWYVEDLGSTNGTYLGRTRLTTPHRLEVGSQLRIGQTVIELQD